MSPGAVSGAALQAVHTIHEARIVHSDLKPANFLMVEGQLKLIDFGIAKAISSDTTSIARESQVGRSDAACRSLQAPQGVAQGPACPGAAECDLCPSGMAGAACWPSV